MFDALLAYRFFLFSLVMGKAADAELLSKIMADPHMQLLRHGRN